MALKIPNTLSNLIFADSQSASLVQQSLTNSVQPLLNFVNQYFTTSGSGASVLLTLNQALTLTKQLLLATGTQANPSLAFAQNNTLGFFYDQANLRMGLVINNTLVGFISAAGMSAQSPSSAGNAFTFYNSSGTAIGSVNNAGTFTSLSASGVPSFVSSQGFKAPQFMGGLAAFSATGGAQTNMQMPGSTNPYVYIPQFTGSVVGYTVYCGSASTSMGATTFKLATNGNTYTLGSASGFTSGSVSINTFGKGLIPIAYNTQMFAQIFPTTTATVSMTFNLTVEMGA